MECTTLVRTLPSHFKSTLTVLRSAAFGPESPVHVPVSGSEPRWSANVGTAITTQASRQMIRDTLNRINLPSNNDYFSSHGYAFLYTLYFVHIRWFHIQ